MDFKAGGPRRARERACREGFNEANVLGRKMGVASLRGGARSTDTQTRRPDAAVCVVSLTSILEAINSRGPPPPASPAKTARSSTMSPSRPVNPVCLRKCNECGVDREVERLMDKCHGRRELRGYRQRQNEVWLRRRSSYEVRWVWVEINTECDVRRRFYSFSRWRATKSDGKSSTRLRCVGGEQSGWKSKGDAGCKVPQIDGPGNAVATPAACQSREHQDLEEREGKVRQLAITRRLGTSEADAGRWSRRRQAPDGNAKSGEQMCFVLEVFTTGVSYYQGREFVWMGRRGQQRGVNGRFNAFLW